MIKAGVWIIAVMLTYGGPVIRTEVPDCSAMAHWIREALAWRDRSHLNTNVVAACYWQEKKA